MIRLIKKALFRQNRNSDKEGRSASTASSDISHKLTINLARLKKIFGTSNDIVIREFNIGQKGQIKGALLFVEGMTDKLLINESLIKPLMYGIPYSGTEEVVTIDTIMKSMISIGSAEKVSSISEVVDGCLSGDTVLLIDGLNEALILNTKGWDSRGVEEPSTGSVGGHITRRLVQIAEADREGSYAPIGCLNPNYCLMYQSIRPRISAK